MEEDELKDKSSEETEVDMETGKKEEDVYSEEGREKLTEDDEMDEREAGFMEGAEGRGEMNCCTYCGKNLGEDEEGVVEREFDGEIKWFCSEEHAQKYADKIEKEKTKQEGNEE